MYQQQVLNKDIKNLRDGVSGDKKALKRRIGIYNLDLYLDENGLLRVGGRMKKSNLRLSNIHPVLIKKDGSIVKLIV